MLTKLKQKVQNMLTLEAKAAHNMGLTPNIVSLIGLSLALFSAFMYAASEGQPLWLFLATVLFLASGFCDALDGVIARIYQQTSVFGGILDSLLDRYADAAVYAGVIIGGLCDPLWGLAALLGSMMVSYCRARAEAAEIMMESVGVAERAERMLILSFAGIAAIFWLPALNIGIILLAVLSNFTVVQRGLHIYNSLKKKSNNLEN
ncbi:CDP-alcohol phosphatidyltransferase family protein [Candidatus Bathyarchaeota archaeon]|nr:CDP-alcohol phosphatidyltransferase family protein [Candidatus Bathyarchaeota archaeon]TRO54100.1 CDP-alcohol phosphatidyltransferase family protein [Candidatus Bathyarchaeota archaeon]